MTFRFVQRGFCNTTLGAGYRFRCDCFNGGRFLYPVLRILNVKAPLHGFLFAARDAVGSGQGTPGGDDVADGGDDAVRRGVMDSQEGRNLPC